MPSYDVVLIHPPAVYDFRRRPIFPGMMGGTVEQVQFTKVPIGMLSIAGYLDRHGYRVRLDNLGDHMAGSAAFDAEEHIKSLSADVYAVGLNFQQHAQGAIEVARLCKRFHPGATVVMGGLTATRFHDEIIRDYDFVDAVIRGEAERPFLELVRALEKHGRLTATPNLTCRDGDGQVLAAPLMPPSRDLDDFDFTRLDLLEPATSVFPPQAPPRWSLEVCRGCVYNCAICGGSAYSYKTYLGMPRPAFRSPGKIVEDVRRLNEQGVSFIGLYQDPRMGGARYWRELLAALRRGKLRLDRLSLDLLAPADEEFIKAVADIGRPVILHICPDTGSDAVRRKLGRSYSSEDLLQTVRLAYRYGIPVTTFFSVGLAGETPEDVAETQRLWEKLSELERTAIVKGSFGDIGDDVPVGGPIIGPILLDPGSPAFDAPEKYGYKLLYKNLREYIGGLSRPSWHQWLNYETDLLGRDALVELVLSSAEFAIEQREKDGVYDAAAAYREWLKVQTDRVIIEEIDRLAGRGDTEEVESRLKMMRSNLDSLLDAPERYLYRRGDSADHQGE